MTYPAETHATPNAVKGPIVTSSQTPITEAAVAEVVRQRAQEIRSKARQDHADELDQAGHPEAAQFLRTNR